MTQIQYLKGDATEPMTPGLKIICHICNDIGGWGAGFVLALSRKWKEPEAEYRNWFKSGKGFQLGEIQIVPVQEDISVANMIGQHDIRSHTSAPPIRYDAVDQCLNKLSKVAKQQNATIHMPRIGCGLAGGAWNHIEPLIATQLSQKDIPVFVYDW